MAKIDKVSQSFSFPNLERQLSFEYLNTPVLEPKQGCDWANRMVLNPAIIKDPQDSGLYMLFRSTGPYSHAAIDGKPIPYPIFIGYAYSDDNGLTWDADFSRPALAPALEYLPQNIYTTDINGCKVVNYANGGIEDPRLFTLEGEVYLTVACRMFPSGPYWDHDEPTQCSPDWIGTDENPFGRAASENLTITVLYKVCLDRLKEKDYDNAFTYVAPLHNPEVSDNRDLFLFQEKMMIDGKSQYVCLHRPKTPWDYFENMADMSPSMFIVAAENISDFAKKDLEHHVMATPMFEWEANRMGGSWPPLKIAENKWLLAYHGKQNDEKGYTQSFMIMEQVDEGLPVVTHRCSERLMYASQDWELQGSNFSIPCLFSCAGVMLDEKQLLIGYGAADERVGVAWTNIHDLVDYICLYDVNGNLTV